MEKFNKFAENLMRVVLVPDETSDSVAPVQHDVIEPKDMFSKEISSYMNDEEGCDTCSSCGESDSDDETHEEVSEIEDIQISHDTNGLKVQFNGMEVTLPNEVVERIKEVLSSDIESEEELEQEEMFPEEQEEKEDETEEQEEDEVEEPEENEEDELKESDASRQASKNNAKKAAQITNEIKKLKKEKGLDHDTAKKEAYKKFGKKGYNEE